MRPRSSTWSCRPTGAATRCESRRSGSAGAEPQGSCFQKTKTPSRLSRRGSVFRVELSSRELFVGWGRVFAARLGLRLFGRGGRAARRGGRCLGFCSGLLLVATGERNEQGANHAQSKKALHGPSPCFVYDGAARQEIWGPLASLKDRFPWGGVYSRFAKNPRNCPARSQNPPAFPQVQTEQALSPRRPHRSRGLLAAARSLACHARRVGPTGSRARPSTWQSRHDRPDRSGPTP